MNPTVQTDLTKASRGASPLLVGSPQRHVVFVPAQSGGWAVQLNLDTGYRLPCFVHNLDSNVVAWIATQGEMRKHH